MLEGPERAHHPAEGGGHALFGWGQKGLGRLGFSRMSPVRSTAPLGVWLGTEGQCKWRTWVGVRHTLKDKVCFALLGEARW